MTQRHPIDWTKYILALLITSFIFGTVLYVNNILDQKRTEDVKVVRDQIALDLLSSETQFDLLKETSCSNISSNTLSEELNSLSRTLGYMEANNEGQNNGELLYLKKYYSLLQIKDYLLMNQLQSKCNIKPLSILYFYGNKEDCPECEKTGIVLTYLRQQYPELRIYSFDTNLNLSALNTLTAVSKIQKTALPALVIDDKKFTGFKTVEEIKDLMPELKKIDEAALRAENASTSTTTNRTTR